MSGPRSDRSLASLLLVQRLAESPAEPLTARFYWPLVRQVPELERLLGESSGALVDQFGLSPDLAAQVALRLDGATALAFSLDELEQAGMRAITAVDDDYPTALTDHLKAAPPVLYVAGDPALLRAPMLGIVGSRNVDEAGADAARGAANEAVRHGHGVASGGAKGVDQLSMRAALEAEGTVVGILADSLVRVLREPETRHAIANGNVCMCTPFKPSSGFSVGNAMGRNKLIYALSAATFVVASDEGSGGTWAGAKEALKDSISPVLSWLGPGSGPGNAALVGLGATGVNGVEELFPLPDRADPVPAEAPKEQLTLGL